MCCCRNGMSNSAGGCVIFYIADVGSRRGIESASVVKMRLHPMLTRVATMRTSRSLRSILLALVLSAGCALAQSLGPQPLPMPAPIPAPRDTPYLTPIRWRAAANAASHCADSLARRSCPLAGKEGVGSGMVGMNMRVDQHRLITWFPESGKSTPVWVTFAAEDSWTF